MDLDWDIGFRNKNTNTELFNDSVIAFEKKNVKDITVNEIIKDSINEKNMSLELCLNIDINVQKPQELLFILCYLSFVSNKLRGLLRNKNTVNYNEELIDTKDKLNYDKLMNYLNWLYTTTSKIKKFFICKNKKDTNIDLDYNIHKLLFKTSSYKFCNYKDSCKIHKNKNKICDKNHFVFDILLIDLQKLIESIELISKDDKKNLFWIIDDNIIIYDKINNIIEKHKFFNANMLNENQMYIDKNLIFKCFDVISFIFNKMYDEAYLFLNYNISSELIII